MKAGITGHQDLGDTTTIKWVEHEIESALNRLHVEKAFSSLAAGADQLFATLALRKNLPLIAVIPSRHYEQTFAAGKREIYYSLLEQASRIIELAYEDPTETAFYEAGKRMVEESDIIFAVWNNRPSRGVGGTADIVAYAKLLNKELIHFNPVSQTIEHLNTS